MNPIVCAQNLQARKTILSPGRHYRYVLWRKVGTDPNNNTVCTFVMLNPSTADETVNDPTITRCMGFAESWGYGWLCVVNLFACRATDPDDMQRFFDPVGPDNDAWLQLVVAEADMVVAAWGVNGSYKNRDVIVKKTLPKLHVLKLTKYRHPAHPLYLKKTLGPQLWTA
ncbi:DUF1643 domain-containing protein [Undibacterium sp. Di26W]|uniref:DUF1643 domain-containing protein n=1 Tax=Undibacterium sp. Di26W TaxID=3413035 RepID=UPI003BF211A0